ncbi:hypothetical protein HYH02_012479 [Chlamydomonas schloesseri]|uniref:WSC domain-containing protein n=1 Tax=Chlamydomonas schloesseri TaxID=2026947 RepID=A0A835SVK8_9CHLO|nr:hypothetical protein HYH02_012479 [Chlamydomonas schloesseri]|eukprot:KAG2434019.1 hypothetical protein HYH02_012479 [Chlamydomonas schloesseri]
MCPSLFVVQKQIGCFGDHLERALDGYYFGYQTDMTVEVCASKARSQGFPYFGVQAGGHCLAGNNLTRALTLYGPASACTSKCTGNNNQYCGGSFQQNVYFTYPEDVCRGNPCDDGGLQGSTCTAVPGGSGLNAYSCSCPANSARNSSQASCTCNSGYSLSGGACGLVQKQIGCFGDHLERALDGYYFGYQTDMTVEVCASKARSQGFPYFGVQAGGHCLAGNNLTRALTLYGPASACTSKCTGNNNQYCGGSFQQNVYFTYPEDVCRGNPCDDGGLQGSTCTAVPGGSGLNAYNCSCPANSARNSSQASCTCNSGYSLSGGACGPCPWPGDPSLGGSYAFSCSSCTVSSSTATAPCTLSCNCRDVSGYTHYSSLPLAACASKLVDNNNGQLTCRAEPQPSLSPPPTPLLAPRPLPSPPPPPSSMRRCDKPSWWCGDTNQVAKQVFCDDDGTLDWICVEPSTGKRGAITSKLSCASDDSRTGWPNAPSSLCPSEFGTASPPPLPPPVSSPSSLTRSPPQSTSSCPWAGDPSSVGGSYAFSCSSCTVSSSTATAPCTLACYCRDGSGYTRSSSLPLAGCASKLVDNNNGQLTCRV